MKTMASREVEPGLTWMSTALAEAVQGEGHLASDPVTLLGTHLGGRHPECNHRSAEGKARAGQEQTQGALGLPIHRGYFSLIDLG